ncbi:hypothetical protein ACTXT7_009167 [Hymenolepis weldensis]
MVEGMHKIVRTLCAPRLTLFGTQSYDSNISSHAALKDDGDIGASADLELKWCTINA